MSNTPPRKAANVNVSPVGNQGNKSQTGILPSHKMGSAGNASAYIRKPAGVTPGGQPVNDKDAGKGTGNLRSGSNKAGKDPVDAWKGVD